MNDDEEQRVGFERNIWVLKGKRKNDSGYRCRMRGASEFDVRSAFQNFKRSRCRSEKEIEDWLTVNLVCSSKQAKLISSSCGQ